MIDSFIDSETSGCVSVTTTTCSQKFIQSTNSEANRNQWQSVIIHHYPPTTVVHCCPSVSAVGCCSCLFLV